MHELESSISDVATGNQLVLREALKADLDAVWAALAQSELTIAQCRQSVINTDDHRCYDALQILYNSLSDLCLAASAIARGEWRPPGIVLRGVFEDIACVVAFICSNDTYVKYKHGKIQSQDCIKIAKNGFPELAKYYGIATRLFTHLDYSALARSYGDMDGKGFRALLVPIDPNELAKPLQLLVLTAMAARFCGSYAELASLSHIDTFYFYKKEEAGLRENLHTAIDPAIRASIHKFECCVGRL